MVIVENPKTYYASNANGLESTTLEVTKAAIAYTLEPAPKVEDVDCKTDASDEKVWKQLEGMKAFVCPKNCSKIAHNVHNNKKEYWYKSSVC